MVSRNIAFSFFLPNKDLKSFLFSCNSSCMCAVQDQYRQKLKNNYVTNNGYNEVQVDDDDDDGERQGDAMELSLIWISKWISK